MAGRRPQVPRGVALVTDFSQNIDDDDTARAVGAVVDAVQSLQGSASRSVVTQDLVIGVNKVRHGLGRPCVGYTLTPTAVSAAFAHAITSGNPRPDLEVWIEVVGADQPSAVVEVF